jgi:hypothetical protein
MYATDISDEADFCTVEFVLMNPTMWNDQNGFLTTLKNQVYHKNSVFYEQSYDINCWWDRPLVVALKHSEEIKLFQQQEAYK